MTDREILEALCGAIAEIDAGCIDCVWDFIHDANRRLAQAGSQYRFTYSLKRASLTKKGIVSVCDVNELITGSAEEGG